MLSPGMWFYTSSILIIVLVIITTIMIISGLSLFSMFSYYMT